VFLLVNLFENGAEEGFVADDFAEALEGLFVGGAGDEEVEIAALGIFFLKMVDGSLPVTLFVKFRVIGQAELDGAADYCPGLDHPVGLGDEGSVDAARGSFGRCAVIFGGLGDELDFVRAEPSAEIDIGPNNFAAFEVMGFPVDGKAEVVAGSGGVKDFEVDGVVLAHIQGPVDDKAGVVFTVGFVEG